MTQSEQEKRVHFGGKWEYDKHYPASKEFHLYCEQET